jgi:hypothetical protein
LSITILGNSRVEELPYSGPQLSSRDLFGQLVFKIDSAAVLFDCGCAAFGVIRSLMRRMRASLFALIANGHWA